MTHSSDCCILNTGNGAWAFDALAKQLADALWLDVSESPRKLNYVLFADDLSAMEGDWFIPYSSILVASDKRVLADVFARQQVPTPTTYLINEWHEVDHFLRDHAGIGWCLKYPLACGAFGHRMLSVGMTNPHDWPRPFIVQEYVMQVRPEVFRTYGAAGELFGWVARRFPLGVTTSPWVAHARGARYEPCGALPQEAAEAGRLALRATGLLDSFGCVDLLQKATGEWVVLEVGTDGLFNHVDRELNDTHLESEIEQAIAKAFWSRIGPSPWGNEPWRRRSETNRL